MYITPRELANKIFELELPYSLFLDLDGTLVEFQENPEGVKIPSEVEDYLLKISQKNKPVTIVSARNASFIQAQLPRLKPTFSASHGCVIKKTPTSEIEILAIKPDLEHLRGIIQKQISEQAGLGTGLEIEVADFSCNVHFRKSALPPLQAEQVVKEIIDSSLRNYNQALDQANRLQATFGDCVVELGPEGVDKGTAIRLFMNEPNFSGTFPIFIGDSL